MRAVIEAALVFSIVSKTRTQILKNEADVSQIFGEAIPT